VSPGPGHPRNRVVEMTEESGGANLCALCAWRENCQKRFSIRSGLQTRCPDFERDLTTLPKEPCEKGREGSKECETT